MSKPFARNKVWVIEEEYKGCGRWTACDCTLWFRYAHRIKRELEPKWPDSKFRVRAYVKDRP